MQEYHIDPYRIEAILNFVFAIHVSMERSYILWAVKKECDFLLNWEERCDLFQLYDDEFTVFNL